METTFHWPASLEAAVSLTYDDGLPVHTALVGPTLERHDLRGTFYPPIPSDLRDHPEHWRLLLASPAAGIVGGALSGGREVC